MKITKEKFTDITETSLDGNTYEACDFSNLKVDYGVLSKVEFIDCNFSNANFTSLRRGVNRLNVVYDGKEKLEMQGGFKTEVDRFKVVPSEAMYIQEDLRIMKNNIEAQFNRGMMNLKTMTAEQNRANALKK